MSNHLLLCGQECWDRASPSGLKIWLLNWPEGGRGVTLPVVCGDETHRCHHVEQGPGKVDQVAGDLVVVVDVGLEASHVDLEQNERGTALLAGVVGDLLVDEHDGLCRRAELINDIVTVQ